MHFDIFRSWEARITIVHLKAYGLQYHNNYAHCNGKYIIYGFLLTLLMDPACDH